MQNALEIIGFILIFVGLYFLIKIVINIYLLNKKNL